MCPCVSVRAEVDYLYPWFCPFFYLLFVFYYQMRFMTAWALSCIIISLVKSASTGWTHVGEQLVSRI
jgi:hypothetical protein